jgi:mercuric ion binding protein
MKKLLMLLGCLFTLAYSPSMFAGSKENPVTDTIRVSGNCGMCKKNIERAAAIKGVKKASWNPDSKELWVTYLPSKTSNEKIQQSIADAGYDTEKIRAKDEVYQNLHTCCQYER